MLPRMCGTFSTLCTCLHTPAVVVSVGAPVNNLGPELEPCTRLAMVLRAAVDAANTPLKPINV